jgi:hypothetical protein
MRQDRLDAEIGCGDQNRIGAFNLLQNFNRYSG